MSPDDILAANLWPWPDPLLKRDPAGNVLFVNAAFLQLYGGRVEDWYGRPIAGWPAPSTHGAQRFETRAGDIGSETVYDWVEMIMADSHAIAIARNITALIDLPTPPAEQAPAPAQQFDLPPIASSQPVPETPPPLAPEPTAPAPAMEAPRAPEPIAVPEPVLAASPAPDLNAEFEQTLNNGADDYAYSDPTTESLTPAQPIAATEMQAPAPEPMPPAPVYTPEPEPAPEERMIERRALPIEDSTAVLGSNWRDQVIAKAIGDVSMDDDNAKPVPSALRQSAEETEENKPGAGLHILLAEDNAINALLTRTLLEADGATVETVEDGALAVQAVQGKHYDLIFMDMRMPNMDGLESTRKIRSLGGHHAKIPIVALTANAFDDDRNACFDSGMNDFMTKPVSAEELSEMVENWTKEGNEAEKKLAS